MKKAASNARHAVILNVNEAIIYGSAKRNVNDMAELIP